MTEKQQSQANVSAPHLWLVQWRAFRAVQDAAQGNIASLGLGLSNFAVLELLLHKGPTPVNTIGKKVLLTSGSITTAIDRLQKQGYVIRRQDENDKRVFRVELTDEGREVIEKAFQIHAEALESTFSILSGEEKETFLDLSKKLGKHASGISADSD